MKKAKCCKKRYENGLKKEMGCVMLTVAKEEYL